MEEGRISVKEWNKIIRPQFKTGELKDISSELPRGFLIYLSIS